MTEQLNAAIGQSLVAIGLYTVAFESMVLSFRAQMHGHLLKVDQASLPAFGTACATADKTFQFCAPKLHSLSVIDSSDIKALQKMRLRRNRFAHQGYDEMMNVSVEDVADDVQLMFTITSKVERWRQTRSSRKVGQANVFHISPRIFGMYLQVARELAQTKLAIGRDCQSGK